MDNVPAFIVQTQAVAAVRIAGPALEAPAEPEPDAATQHQPAVTVRNSLTSREHIIFMIDDEPYKTLKRHISRHGLTSAEYRDRYGLKANYRTAAPAYGEHRRDVGKSLGLGQDSTPMDEADIATPQAGVEEEPVAALKSAPLLQRAEHGRT